MSDLFAINNPETIAPSAPAASGLETLGAFPGQAVNATATLAAVPGQALGGLLPGAVRSPLARVSGLERPRLPAFDRQYQRNLSTLTNKYTELGPQIAALPEPVRNALIEMDSARVAKGASPLTRRQTLLAMQAATTDQQATPEPDRNPLNVLGNFRSDLATILRSIPRLPLAMVNEVRDLPRFGQYMAEAQAAGQNQIEALAGAPGVRMIPGSYIVGGLAGGAEGVRELATHPLMAGLDALPAASKVAAGTKVGRLAAEASEIAGRRPRPLAAVLNNKVAIDPATGAETLARTRLGSTIDFVRDETRLGQQVDAAFGRRSRQVASREGFYRQRKQMFAQGIGDPETVPEQLVFDSAKLFDRHAATYPQLVDPSPEGAAFRVQLKRDFERGTVDAYDPALVGDYRDLVDRMANYAATQDQLGRFDGEWYDTATASKLRGQQAKIASTEHLLGTRNEYLAPSGQLSPDALRGMWDRALSDTTRLGRGRGSRAAMMVLDAYGYDTTGVRSALSAAQSSKGTWDAVQTAVTDTLATTPGPIRRSVSEIIDVLKRTTDDRQVTILERAVANGRIGEAGKALRNLYNRKPPAFDDAAWVGFREDIASAARRMDFDARVGSKATDARLAAQQRTFEKMRAAAPPARFDALLTDEYRGQVTTAATRAREQALGRDLTPDEAASVVADIQAQRWAAAFPDMDEVSRTEFLRGIERDVASTWQTLRDAGHDPLFVHKVSPSRVNALASGNIGPVPQAPSQSKARAFDLSPGVDDLQVSLSHQAVELLDQTYREKFLDEVIESAGVRESDLLARVAQEAEWRAAQDPVLDVRGHAEQIIKRGWERFNPEQAGASWGGVRLDKYRQEQWFVPKSVATNLHRMTAPPSMMSQVFEPFTKAFRFNVIGLSAGVVINNFFSNMAATMAEQGPGMLRNFSKAREWLADPAKIPSNELRAIMAAENIALDTVDRSAWLSSKAGQRYLMGLNAGQAFMDSAVAQGAKKGYRALEAVAEKSMRLQGMGDNMYRAMVYMDEYEKLSRKGLDATAAEKGAIEATRRSLIDWTTFTPIERSAIRTIFPFYSYMGHAARFIMRYPMDHPVRAAVAASLAREERERLGALPEKFLGYLPIGKVGADGKQTMIPLRPFDAFGDIGDLLSVSGWLAATNPLLTTVLESAGMQRGEAEMYPTLRYDPETGRLVPVQGGFASNLLQNTLPRAGLPLALLGMNPTFNELRGRDPGAANRSLASMAGLPRLWQSVSVPTEQFKAEVARQKDASAARAAAEKSGNWGQALRYPSLRAYYAQLLAMPDNYLAPYTAEDPAAIEARINQMVGGAR